MVRSKQRAASYMSRKIKLTPENVKHLMSRKRTRIDPHQIDVEDGHTMFVNPAQSYWLDKSKEAGLPVHIPPMTKQQMAQNLRGGSVFSQLVSGLSAETKKGLIDKAEGGARDLTNAVFDKIQDVGTEKGLPRITKRVIEEVGKPLIEKLIKIGSKSITKLINGHGLGANGCGFAKCRGSRCKKAMATTPQRLYPASQQPI